MKQHIEQALHNSSLSLASIYHELRNSNDDHQTQMDNIMLAYTSTRRAMEKNHDGKRFGSTEAYRAMTLGEQPDATIAESEQQLLVEGVPRYELDLDSLTYTRI